MKTQASSTGEGKKFATATTGTLVSPNFSARKASVYNADAAIDVYAMVNGTVAQLLAMVAAGTAIVIPAGSSFVFDTMSKRGGINSVVVASASGTPTVYLGMY